MTGTLSAPVVKLRAPRPGLGPCPPPAAPRGAGRPAPATGSPEHLLNGPQINPEGKTDVVQDQADVDDLLASLGF